MFISVKANSIILVSYRECHGFLTIGKEQELTFVALPAVQMTVVHSRAACDGTETHDALDALL
jgi:hypothetical protein